MNMERILKDYKNKKAFIEATIARIEAYEYALDNPELICDFSYTLNSNELGMPGAPLRNTSSPVEKIVIERELTKEVIEEWIREDKSRMFRTKMEVAQIERAMICLTPQERFVIDCKYFDNMFWKDIEMNFNDKFRHKNYVTFECLKKMNKGSLEKLENILRPYYSRWNVA